MPLRSPAARLAGGLVTLAAALGSAAILASFAGDVIHPLDSVSHFRLHLSVALAPIALAALLLRRWTGAAYAVLGTVAGLATTLPFVLPQPVLETGGASYTLLQMNLRYDAPDRDPALRTIADLRPDIVTLEEVTQDWRDRFETLRSAYPFQHYCGTYGKGGSAILSRRPFSDAPETTICRIEDGLAARGIDFNGRAVTVSALHLDWPWPRRHWGQIGRLAPILPKLPQPAILGGDFNAAPWSAAVRSVAGEAGWRVVEGIGPTFLPAEWHWMSVRRLGLPIDNVLASPGIRILEARSLAATGSDHLPVLVRFALDAPDPSDPASPALAARVNAN